MALSNRLDYLKKTFGITFSQEDLDRWDEELSSGTGRNLDELWRDILVYRVGENEVAKLVKDWLGAAEQPGDVERMVAELMNPDGAGGNRGFNELSQDIQNYRPTSALATGTPGGAPPTRTDTSPGGTALKGNTGGSATPGVMKGGKLMRVTRPNAPDTYVMAYDWNGTTVYWTFEGQDQVKAALGDNWLTQISGTVTHASLTSGVDAGDASEIIGNKVHFNTFVNEAQVEAAQAAGLNDPTMLSKLVNDPAYQRLLAEIAVDIDDWTPERIMSEVRNLPVYQNEIFPGITNFFGYDDPEQQWYAYQSNVEDALESLGVKRDPDGSYRKTIGQMLNNKVSDSLFMQMTPTFIKAQNNIQYAATLDKWFQKELGRSIDFNSWYDVLSGTADADALDVANKATLQHTSTQALGGDALTDAEVERVAGSTTLSEEQARMAMSEFGQTLQSMEGVMGKYGVTRDELISLATGIESPTGRSLQETRRLAQQAAMEAGMQDDEKLKYYLGFSPLGRPERPGLQDLAPEGA